VKSCSSCGADLNQGGKFCTHCGAAATGAPGGGPEPSALAPAIPPASVAAPVPPGAPFPVSLGQRTKRRSAAWIYYAVLSLVGVVAAAAGTPQALLGTAVAALYAVYLFRGGRVVIWFW
jgi:hypothetical protein